MRIACVLIHNLAVQVATINDPQLQGQPLIIGGSPFEVTPLYDASPEAIACGVKQRMPLRQAYALCPQARFLPSDERRYEEMFQRVITILDGFSPVVEVEGTGCAYLDINGVHSEHDLACEIRDSIFLHTKLNACLGISSNKFLSRTGAFVAKPEAPVIVPQGKEGEFIAPFSIDFLPCSAETKKRFHLLGIHIMQQLWQFSREALEAQFGSDGTIIYRLANGIDRTLLIARKRPELISDAAEFDALLITSQEIAQTAQLMLDRLLAEIKARDKVCNKIKLRLRFSSGSLRERELPLKEGTNSKTVIVARLIEWLENISFPEAVSEMELSLELGREKAKKLYLLPQLGGRKEEVSKVAKLLRTGFGYQPLKRALVSDPDALLPERRFKYIDF